MKNLILLITLLVLSSCVQNTDQTNRSIKTTKLIGSYGNSWELEIIEIDGCEYFFCSNIDNKMFTHKGNCKNHRNN